MAYPWDERPPIRTAISCVNLNEFGSNLTPYKRVRNNLYRKQTVHLHQDVITENILKLDFGNRDKKVKILIYIKQESEI